jgi:glycosyltransferase involved in cell wall biosynthesis
MENKSPLVSVGIPTYNRPEGLRRTLECITRQTYKNLEIIISDNCSPGHETEAVAREFMEKDSRIQYFRKAKNMGGVFNFKFVLEQATGEYFMWAADDDKWESIFVECCLKELLQQGDEFVAVMMEAQYFSDRGFYDFFPEGVPFYNSNIINPYERMSHMLDYNYGNLYYSLFRRDVLFENSVSFFSLLNLISLNEIPLFLFVSVKGQWRVLPQIGLYKRTNDFTYAEAKWEKQGGKLPNSKGIRYFNRLPTSLRYHRSALKDITNTIDLLNIDQTTKQSLKLKARNNILKHFTYFITRRKTRLF